MHLLPHYLLPTFTSFWTKNDVWLQHSSILLLIAVQLNCEIPLQQTKRSRYRCQVSEFQKSHDTDQQWVPIEPGQTTYHRLTWSYSRVIHDLQNMSRSKSYNTAQCSLLEPTNIQTYRGVAPLSPVLVHLRSAISCQWGCCCCCSKRAPWWRLNSHWRFWGGAHWWFWGGMWSFPYVD